MPGDHEGRPGSGFPLSRFTLFGRSALALGYSPAPAHFHNTKGVDGILPLSWLQPPDDHEDFWRAGQLANSELEPDGLYLTHLFREVDVIRHTVLPVPQRWH